MTDDTRTTIPTPIDAEETLRQIQARADVSVHGVIVPNSYADHYRRDIPTLVAALRAVLDLADEYAVQTADGDPVAHMRQNARRAVAERFRAAVTSALSQERP